MGTTLMPNLTLVIGKNSVAAHTTFSASPPSPLCSALLTTQFYSQPNNSPEGREVLDNFVGKKGEQVLKNPYSTVLIF